MIAGAAGDSPGRQAKAERPPEMQPDSVFWAADVPARRWWHGPGNLSGTFFVAAQGPYRGGPLEDVDSCSKGREVARSLDHFLNPFQSLVDYARGRTLNRKSAVSRVLSGSGSFEDGPCRGGFLHSQKAGPNFRPLNSRSRYLPSACFSTEPQHQLVQPKSGKSPSLYQLLSVGLLESGSIEVVRIHRPSTVASRPVAGCHSAYKSGSVAHSMTAAPSNRASRRSIFACPNISV